jgi:hypothetical protein
LDGKCGGRLFRALGLREFTDHRLLGMQGYRLRGGMIREEGFLEALIRQPYKSPH